MIDITGIDLAKFVSKVYELSAPKGLGFIHYTPKPLDDSDIKDIINTKHENIILSMDYIYGRACKMTVWEKDGKWIIKDSWYDHEDSKLQELLSTFNITAPLKEKHLIGCECNECLNKKYPLPKECYLDSWIVQMEISAGHDPCAGCNLSREKCHGRPKKS